MNNAWSAMPSLPVAWGEVFDKLTILHIKAERITDPERQQNIQRELEAINSAIGDLSSFPIALQPLVDGLKQINDEIWEVEEGKRRCESEQRFDDHFIHLARQVYLLNDKRAVIKKQINQVLGSSLIEEKSHSSCQ